MDTPFVCKRSAVESVRRHRTFFRYLAPAMVAAMVFHASQAGASKLGADLSDLVSTAPFVADLSPNLPPSGFELSVGTTLQGSTGTVDRLVPGFIEDTHSGGNRVGTTDLLGYRDEPTLTLPGDADTCLSAVVLRTLTQPRAGEAFNVLLSSRKACVSALAPEAAMLTVDGDRFFAGRADYPVGLDQHSAYFQFEGLVLPAGLHDLTVELGSGDSLKTEILVEDAKPPLVVQRAWSANGGNDLEPRPAPIPGATLRLNIQYPGQWPETVAALYATRDATYVLDAVIDRKSTALLMGGNVAVRIDLPPAIPPSRGHLRIAVGDRHSDWLEFEIADPRFVEQRDRLAEDLMIDLLASSDPDSEPVLFGPWRPLPPAARIVDAVTGELLYETDSPVSFLFYSGDGAPVPADSLANWYVLGGNGERLAEGKIDRRRPEVRTPDGAMLFAGGDSGPLYQEAGPADPGDRTGIRRDSRGSTSLAGEDGGWSADDSAFSGMIDLEVCPDGIRKIAVILQLDDELVKPRNTNANSRKSAGPAVDAFKTKRERTRRMFQDRGFDEIHVLTPTQLIGSVPDYRIDWDKLIVKSPLRSLDLTAYYALITQILFGIEHDNAEACTELVVATLSHGLLKTPSDVERKRDPKTGKLVAAGAHRLSFRHIDKRYPGKDTIATYQLVRDTVEIFDSFENNETPITFLLNACHSQKPLKKIAQEVKKIAIHPDVLLIASSGGSQKTRSINRGSGDYRTPFIDAFGKVTGALVDKKTWGAFEKQVKEASKVRMVDVGGGVTTNSQRPHREFIPRSGK